MTEIMQMLLMNLLLQLLFVRLQDYCKFDFVLLEAKKASIGYKGIRDDK